ncbi:MAG: hypothetical protein ABIP62_05320, partial [Vicinamibacteria bacterium]
MSETAEETSSRLKSLLDVEAFEKEPQESEFEELLKFLLLQPKVAKHVAASELAIKANKSGFVDRVGRIQSALSKL